MQRFRTMNHRAIALGIASAAFLAALVPLHASAQGLRAASGGNAAGNGLSRAMAAPALPAPARAVSGVRQADYIVAVVNFEPVTNNEVNARVARVALNIQSQGGQMPPQDLLAREVLERLILEKILLQQARETGIRVDDYAVDQAEKNVANQNGLTIEDLRRRLVSDGFDPKAFRDELRNQMLVQRLRERDLESRVRVSDVEVEQYLQEKQGTDEAGKAAINLGHVLIHVPENASADVVAAAQARAQAAADKARAPGADFAAVAREYSDAPEGRQGGELGLRPADRYPELFLDATAKTAVGGVVGPVRSPAGFHVLKVLEKSSGGAGAMVTQNHARHILLTTNAQLSESAAAERLAEYRRRIEMGQATFESLAREYSKDGSAKQGGDLGWAAPGRYVPEFEQALANLRPGQISDPVVSRFGVHLIQLVERRDVALTAREQRDMARDVVREKKLEDAYTTWAQEQRARAYVEYREPPQ
jgi:peptidyl-prolyl cis-trans isomerase SurA